DHTYAQTLRCTFSGKRQITKKTRIPEAENQGTLFPEQTETEKTESVYVMAYIKQLAIDAKRRDSDIRKKIESASGMPWYGVQQFLIDHLPEHLEDRRQFAYNLVSKAMNAVFGPQPTAWETFKNPTTGKTWIRVNK